MAGNGKGLGPRFWIMGILTGAFGALAEIHVGDGAFLVCLIASLLGRLSMPGE